MKRVGHDQVRRFNRFAWEPELSHCCRDQRRGKPFAQARNRVEGAWREFPKKCCSFAEPSPFREYFFHATPDPHAVLLALDQAGQGSLVLLPQRIDNRDRLSGTSCLRPLCSLDQPV